MLALLVTVLWGKGLITLALMTTRQWNKFKVLSIIDHPLEMREKSGGKT